MQISSSKYVNAIFIFSFFTGCTAFHQTCCSIEDKPVLNVQEQQSNTVMLIPMNSEIEAKASESNNTKKSLDQNISKKEHEVVSIQIKSVDKPEDVQRQNNQISSIYFDFNEYSIRTDMIEVLQKNSELIRNKKVVLEGNCDEFGSGEYNYALGLKRANEVKNRFIKLGIISEMIDITSFGEDNPSCFESSMQCWQKNRRVDVKVRPRE